MLSQTHRPYEDSLWALHEEAREVFDSTLRDAALSRNHVPVRSPRVSNDRACTCRDGVDERVIYSTVFVESLEHADEEREIAACVHIEPVVGDSRAVKRACRNRWHP